MDTKHVLLPFRTMKKQTPITTSPEGIPPGSDFRKARRIAARFSLSPKTIFRWSSLGYFPRYKINGRVVLFRESEVAAFIESGRVT